MSISAAWRSAWGVKERFIPGRELLDDGIAVDELPGAGLRRAQLQRGVQASALSGLEVVVLDDRELDLSPIG